MAEAPMIFALANPTSDVAHKYASIVTTGRLDYLNPIKIVLAFPGIFLGALAAGGVQISEGMKLAAVRTIADLVEEPTAECIVPPGLSGGCRGSSSCGRGRTRWLIVHALLSSSPHAS